MKKTIIAALCLFSGAMLQAGNTHSDAHIGHAAEPVVSDNQLLADLHDAVEANSPDQVTDVLIAMYRQHSLKRLINRYIVAVNDPANNQRRPCSALQLAAYHGYDAIVETLLDWEANVNGINHDLEDPFIDRHTDVIMTPLQLAAGKGHSSTVQQLLQHNANPNLRFNKVSDPALYEAIKSHCPADTLQLLLAKGAQYNRYKLLVDDTGTALHCAAQNSNDVAIEVLLASIPDENMKLLFINLYTFSCQTALHFAAAAGHCPSIKMLLDNGADINRQDINGQTPLMKAQEHHADDAANLLIARGALH